MKYPFIEYAIKDIILNRKNTFPLYMPVIDISIFIIHISIMAFIVPTAPYVIYWKINRFYLLLNVHIKAPSSII